jgi:hypothetical protein
VHCILPIRGNIPETKYHQLKHHYFRTVSYHNEGFLVAAVVLTGKHYLMVLLYSCKNLRENF